MPQLYARVFLQILDSSLAEDYQTRHVFEDMLKLVNQDGVVDMTHQAIARRTNVPLEIIKNSILKLESPDPHSRDQEHEGRRLIRLDEHRDWGWRILNWQKYEMIRVNNDMREWNTARMAHYRDNRDKKKAPPEPPKESNSTPTPTPTPECNPTCRLPVVLPDDKHVVLPVVLQYQKIYNQKVQDPEPKELLKMIQTFWDAYPKKKNKVDTEIAFSQVKAHLFLPEILRSLEWQSKTKEWTEENGKWIPMPARYLRDMLWKDEPVKINGHPTKQFQPPRATQPIDYTKGF